MGEELVMISEEKIDQVLQRMADTYGQQMRSPVLHSPAEHGLEYEEVTFPASDGTPLEGWYIPAPGSDRLIIANHPRGFSRAGMPTHLEPWRSVWKSSGNDWEIDFVPDYKILHDAGHHVLTYDLRNHGYSSAANGGVVSSGLFESRDVLGSLAYTSTRPDTRDLGVALFSRCLGANSTIAAMMKRPDAFRNVRAMVACQPLTPQMIAERLLELAGVPVDRIGDLDRRVTERTGISFADREVREWARTVDVPTFVYQVRDDVLTRPEDVQSIFDNIRTEDKKLMWIENSTSRWDGYAEFQRRPEPMLAWFADHFA
jgi:hypothetical protein